MKAIRSKAVLMGLLGATAIATTWVGVKSANAGLKESYSIVVSDAGKYAKGQLADVRSSGSNLAHITIIVTSFGSEYWRSARMVAKSGGSSPITRECITYDPELVSYAAGVNGDSYIEFGWNNAGDCTHITVSQGSTMSPKVP